MYVGLITLKFFLKKLQLLYGLFFLLILVNFLRLFSNQMTFMLLHI